MKYLVILRAKPTSAGVDNDISLTRKARLKTKTDILAVKIPLQSWEFHFAHIYHSRNIPRGRSHTTFSASLCRLKILVRKLCRPVASPMI